MKSVTKKILESGLVDKHVAAMLARWGTIEQDDAHSVGRQSFETKEQLEAFAEELEELLDKEEATMRETPLDWPASGPPKGFQVKGSSALFIGCRDSMGRLVVAPHIRLKRGAVIIDRESDEEHQVTEINFFYKGEAVIAQLLTID